MIIMMRDVIYIYYHFDGHYDDEGWMWQWTIDGDVHIHMFF